MDNDVKNEVLALIGYKTQKSRDEHVTCYSDGSDLAIEHGQMYDRPEPLSLSQMVALRDYFDAKDVKQESGVASAGCETCDYGSNYETIIRVIGARKHADLAFTTKD